MKIRTQLILAFLLLSVLPLTGIVLYSYYSSQRALRAAELREAEQMAQEMDRRLAEVRREVGEQVASLADLPLGSVVEAATTGEVRSPIAGMIATKMSAIAPFVDSIEIHPPAAPPRTAEPPVPGAVAPPAPPAPPAVVIDIEEIMRNVEQALESVDEVAIEREAEKAAEQWAEGYTKQMEAWAAELEKWEAQESFTIPPIPPMPSVAPSSERTLEQVRRQAERIQRRRDRPSEREADRPAVSVRPATGGERREEQARILFGHDLDLPVERHGEIVGEIRPRLRPEMLIASILELAGRGNDEIPFAVDREGTLYAPNEPSREKVAALGVTDSDALGQRKRILDNWVIATSRHEESGLTLGIARPIREPLADIRRAAGRNFAYGIGLIGIALIGMIPIANHMARDVEVVTDGAERIAQGDLDTEVPVRSKGELGALAVAFNQMARDLRDHQSRLVHEERRRKEEEIQRRLLAADFDRKSQELEEARRFQLSLLPKQLPDIPGVEIAVYVRTATEVGGDYYDFHVGEDRRDLTIAVGDATGHGARAGTMVTIVKSLFSTYRTDRSPGAFLAEAGDTVRRMELGRMTMALQLVRLTGNRLTLASAAMPPALVYRAATGHVDELLPVGMPLGTFDAAYAELTAQVAPGDTLLLMSDGFPELLDREGEPLGYAGVEAAFANVASESPDDVIAALASAASARTGGAPPNDDITFVVVKLVASS